MNVVKFVIVIFPIMHLTISEESHILKKKLKLNIRFRCLEKGEKGMR